MIYKSFLLAILSVAALAAVDADRVSKVPVLLSSLRAIPQATIKRCTQVISTLPQPIENSTTSLYNLQALQLKCPLPFGSMAAPDALHF